MSAPVIIGDATLYLGDCREILPTLPKVDAVITDPPYGVYLGDHAASTDFSKKHLNKAGYISYDDTPENFSTIVVPALKAAINKAARSMVFGVPPGIWQLPAPACLGGVFISSGCGRTAWGFTCLVHCLMYGAAAQINKGCMPSSIADNSIAEKDGHPVQKPIRWMNWAVNLGSSADDMVLDPFMGSGTTGVACMNLGRKFIGIEIEERYFNIACERIENAQRQIKLFDRSRQISDRPETALLPGM